MKALPCRRCKDVALLPNGDPYLIGRAPDFQHGIFRYTCSRCRAAWEALSITAADFARLPRVSLAQLRKWNQDWRITKDLGLTAAQADDLERANVDWQQLHR